MQDARVDGAGDLAIKVGHGVTRCGSGSPLGQVVPLSPLIALVAVHSYHWMTNAQFLSAVALDQVMPGPVVQTVAVVGYAAAGFIGGLLAALVAFTPSFVFVLVGGPHFDGLRRSRLIGGNRWAACGARCRGGMGSASAAVW